MESINQKPFRKLIADEHDEVFKFLLRNPLLLAIYIVCTIRARRIQEPSPEGLEQGEFWLSEEEYEDYGLKKTQKGQIRRRINSLIKSRIIQKIENKTGNQNATVYRLISTRVIDPNFQTEDEIANVQRTYEDHIETNNNDKNDENVKNAISNRNLENSGNTESSPYKEKTNLHRGGGFTKLSEVPLGRGWRLNGSGDTA